MINLEGRGSRLSEESLAFVFDVIYDVTTFGEGGGGAWVQPSHSQYLHKYPATGAGWGKRNLVWVLFSLLPLIKK